jgi:hypothetical protein
MGNALRDLAVSLLVAADIAGDLRVDQARIDCVYA